VPDSSRLVADKGAAGASTPVLVDAEDLQIVLKGIEDARLRERLPTEPGTRSAELRAADRAAGDPQPVDPLQPWEMKHPKQVRNKLLEILWTVIDSNLRPVLEAEAAERDVELDAAEHALAYQPAQWVLAMLEQEHPEIDPLKAHQMPPLDLARALLDLVARN
jgi:hypothetical protein